jgi:hypothetical protein
VADEADRADDRIENAKADGISEASRAVAAMPVGNPGECSGCGEMSGRLVNGYCAPCRDRYARFIR